MFTIRKATIDDRSLIHDLASRIWENTYGKILSKEQLDYMFDMMYAGYLSIEKTGENTYNFQKIYSLPEMHGTGIGRFIIEQGINYLKEVHTGPFTIELYVNRYNPAIGFYRHMGLREIGTRDHHIGNGYFMNDYIMSMEVENK